MNRPVFESLKQQEPVVVWDDKGRAPSLQTDADWIRAGELVFDAPLVMNTNGATPPSAMRNEAGKTPGTSVATTLNR